MPWECGALGAESEGGRRRGRVGKELEVQVSLTPSASSSRSAVVPLCQVRVQGPAEPSFMLTGSVSSEAAHADWPGPPVLVTLPLRVFQVTVDFGH